MGWRGEKIRKEKIRNAEKVLPSLLAKPVNVLRGNTTMTLGAIISVGQKCILSHFINVLKIGKYLDPNQLCKLTFLSIVCLSLDGLSRKYRAY